MVGASDQATPRIRTAHVTSGSGDNTVYPALQLMLSSYKRFFVIKETNQENWHFYLFI